MTTRAVRTTALVFATTCLAPVLGCEKAGKVTPAGGAADRARVNAVAPKAKAAVDLDDFCETRPAADQAKAFAFPGLQGSAPTRTPGTWRWVNVWATWCKPCIEELPLLASWRGRFSSAKLPVELVFLAIDSADLVTTFRGEHPGTPETLLIDDPDKATAWLTALGLPEGAVLPVHLFVDPDDRVRCVRMGGVGEGDFAAVEALVRGG